MEGEGIEYTVTFEGELGGSQYSFTILCFIINVQKHVHKLMFSYEITSPTDARNNLFKLLDQIVENHQVFIINRRDGENVALIAESDLVSLAETVYLLRSPENARRLLDAIEESKAGGIQSQTIADLRQELGIEQAEAEES